MSKEISFMFGRKIVAMNARWDRAAKAALARDDAAFEKHMTAFWRLAGKDRPHAGDEYLRRFSA